MVVYDGEACQLEHKFDGLELNHIPRRLNEAANALAKTAFGREPVPMGVFTSDQYKPLVHYEELEQVSDGPPALGSRANQPMAPSNLKVMDLNEYAATEPNPLADWRTPYLDYLLHEALPTDKMEARRLTRRAKSFVIIEGELYRRSHTRIL